MSAPPPEILFITATRIGDVVLSSGLVRHLVQAHPGARLTIAGGAAPLSLFADTPGLARLLPMIKQRRGGHWLDLWRQTRGVRWDLVVDLRGSLSAYALRARQRRVMRKSPAGQHKVQAYAEVLSLGRAPPAPGFFVSPERAARAQARRPIGRSVLALAPAANWVGKTWPADRFAALARDLLDGPLAGAQLLLLGGREDAATVDQVAAALPGVDLFPVVGEPDLLDIYALLRGVRLFVGNDSGMMHLAAAAGVPTLGLFDPSDDRLYAPWGETAAVVRATPFETFLRSDPGLNQAAPHMDSLSLAQVRQAAFDLLARTGSRQAS